jgi:hypothetical protein
MVLIFKYPEWILRGLEKKINLMKIWKKKFMIFQRANKPSFNITWGHSKTLNVIPFQWFFII